MKTRILVVIAHFFKDEMNSKYSSTNGAKKDERQKALIESISGWLTLSKSNRHIDVSNKHFINTPSDIGIDIIIVKNDENHLISSILKAHKNIKTTQVNVDDTRYLPFAAHHVMKNNLDKYDWFVYSEDDLYVGDPDFFEKVKRFNEKFGNEFVIMPNRFEMNLNCSEPKTFVDGFNQHPEFIKYLEKLNKVEQKSNMIEHFGKMVKFEQAKNPHSGCFIINSFQLKEWTRKKFFGKLDSEFVSPLESAATHGMIKTFKVMKPSPENAEWLEIRHLDTKFSNLNFSTV